MASRDQVERHLARALNDRIPTLRDPRVPLVVTVERVLLSADRERATVLVSTLDPADLEDLLAALDRAAGHLQREVSAELGLRRTPRLHFTADPAEALG